MKMTASSKARYDAHARIMQALSHPTRLFIVEELSRRECHVTELTKMIGNQMATVSRHLGVLKNAGLIQDEKRGPQVFYRVSSNCVMKFFDCLKAIQSTDPQS